MPRPGRAEQSRAEQRERLRWGLKLAPARHMIYSHGIRAGLLRFHRIREMRGRTSATELIRYYSLHKYNTAKEYGYKLKYICICIHDGIMLNSLFLVNPITVYAKVKHINPQRPHYLFKWKNVTKLAPKNVAQIARVRSSRPYTVYGAHVLETRRRGRERERNGGRRFFPLPGVPGIY